MDTTLSDTAKQGRKQKQDKPEWPKEVQPGRAVVRVYRRKTPAGNWAYMVANYADGERRRFDSYANEADALSAADTLAKRLDKRDYVAASMSREQAIEYADSVAALTPYGVGVRDATNTVALCLKDVGDLNSIIQACRFYKARRKTVTAKSVTKAVDEILKVKAVRTKNGRPASRRYLKDLSVRLGCFARDCKKDVCNVTTPDVQDWLDSLKSRSGKKLSPQSYKNHRTVLSTFFEFCVARGFAADNVVEGTDAASNTDGEIVIYKPQEIARLLAAAHAQYADFLPVLAIGAFAGLRSAELERLEWGDVDLVSKHITVSAGKAKTASRRIVPIADNLAAWLRDYANLQGNVWKDSGSTFYKRQLQVAKATAVEADEVKGTKAQPALKWKDNALRHSFISYRLAETQNAAQVALEAGNSPKVIFRHYRELVKPEAAKAWFAVTPERPGNVLPIAAAMGDSAALSKAAPKASRE